MQQSEFHRQSLKLQKEGEMLITTLESMMATKTTSSLEERLNNTASYVGKSKATLEAKMEKQGVTLS